MADAFDHVGIEGALDQVTHVAEFQRFALERLDELTADDLALFFRVGRSTQGSQELPGGIDHPAVEVKRPEHLLQLFGFLFPHHAVIDKYTGQLLPDGPMGHGRGHRAIDAAAQGTEHFLLADLSTDVIDGIVQKRSHGPGRSRSANMTDEVFEDACAVRGMGDLGVKLQAVEAMSPIHRFHRGNGRIRRPRNGLESGRHRFNPVSVRHPDRKGALPGQPPEEIRSILNQ